MLFFITLMFLMLICRIKTVACPVLNISFTLLLFLLETSVEEIPKRLNAHKSNLPSILHF